MFNQLKIDQATQEARKELNSLLSTIYENHVYPHEYEQSKSRIIDNRTIGVL